nr:unnamed protein product [Digitaria exilis]
MMSVTHERRRRRGPWPSSVVVSDGSGERPSEGGAASRAASNTVGAACGREEGDRSRVGQETHSLSAASDRRRSRRAARGSSPETVVVAAVEPEKEEEDGKAKRKEEEWRRGLTGARRCDARRREQGLAAGKGCGARRMRRRRGRKKVAGNEAFSREKKNERRSTDLGLISNYPAKHVLGTNLKAIPTVVSEGSPSP